MAVSKSSSALRRAACPIRSRSAWLSTSRASLSANSAAQEGEQRNPVSAVTTSRIPLARLATIGPAGPLRFDQRPRQPLGQRGEQDHVGGVEHGVGGFLPAQQLHAVVQILAIDRLANRRRLGTVAGHQQPPAGVGCAAAAASRRWPESSAVVWDIPSGRRRRWPLRWGPVASGPAAGGGRRSPAGDRPGRDRRRCRSCGIFRPAASRFAPTGRALPG